MISKVRIQNSLLANFSVRFIANVLSKLLSLITLPIIGKNLGPDYFGKWNLSLTILGYMSLPFTLGLIPFGIREIVKKNKTAVNEIISVRLMLFFFFYLIGILCVFFIFKDDYILLYSVLIGSVYLFANAINIEFYYIANNNFYIPMISQILGQVVFVIITFLYVKSNADFLILTWGYSGYFLLMAIIQLSFYLKENIITFSFKFSLIVEMIKKTYKLGVGNLIENISTSMPLIFIAFFCGSNELGIFSASFKIISILVMIYQTIMIVLTPRIASMKTMKLDLIREKVIKTSIVLLGIGALSSVFCFLLSKELIIQIFGMDYYEAIYYFRILLVFYVPLVPVAMYLNNVIVYLEKDKVYLISTFISALATIFLSPVFIYYFSVHGAIVSICISMFLYFCAPIYMLKIILTKTIYN